MRTRLRVVTVSRATALLLALLVWRSGAAACRADESVDERVKEVTAALTDLDTRALPADERTAARQMLAKNISERLRAANQKSTKDWREIKSRADWETFRSAKLSALHSSLGQWPDKPAPPRVVCSGTIAGDGFVIDKLLYETRPGLWVSANLYRPADSAPLPTAPGAAAAAGVKNRPAIILSHSHHNPKTEGELQTMGMTWARLGALVLVPDHLGHGERRQHPFRTDADYPKPFKRSRQDYYFRYDVDMQLELVGESLMGWLAWDLMRGLDVVLTQGEVDPNKTIILGAVAGGGDVAAVTAALDPRFAAAAVFNFGGPQPESRYPLPEDSEDRFGYAGSGDWESTRNLRGSAAGGFLPWVIVGGIAPRRLIYAHEFSWDQEHDPVWKRLERIYSWYDVPDRLAFAHGSGSVKGQPPESTHCNNIGGVHRRGIYPALARWFGMPAEVEEYAKTRPAAELQCWTDELREQLKPKLAREVAAAIGAERTGKLLQRLDSESPEDRREELQHQWSEDLHDNSIFYDDTSLRRSEQTRAGSIRVERVVIDVEPGIHVRLVLLRPAGEKPTPVVVGVAQQGKQRLLSARRDFIARLLTKGVAVCLVDVRGTGETAPNDSGRDRTSHATSLSSSEQMLGGTLLGAQLNDLHLTLRFLGREQTIDRDRIAVWGDSLAEMNPPDRQIVVPHAADNEPGQAEPLGGLLALFEATFTPEIRAVYIRRGLASYASAFEGPVVCLPHDAIVPGAAAAGDLPLVAAELARSLRMEGAIDASNRILSPAALESAWAAVRSAYKAKDAAGSLVLCEEGDATAAADWLVARLTGD